jgi:hypothetical protein
MDLEVIETKNGGDLVLKQRDISVIFGFQNMPYLAMFGGNLEASTPQTRVDSEQYFDWWGNELFFPDDDSLQMNSNTERVLGEVALNSFGRSLIEKAIKKDLDFMRSFAEVTVSVSIVSTNRAEIYIKIVRLDNQSEREFIYIWDATNRELTEQVA